MPAKSAPDPALVVAGVDTHSKTHHVAVLDAATGARLGDHQFAATKAGYIALAAFITSFGTVQLIGVEGTASYGAGLYRYLHAAGYQVAEVIRPKRAQRRRGKSDPIDAYAAAEQALADKSLPIPKTGDGIVEQIRVTLTTRRSAVKARAALTRQIKSILVTAPDELRARYDNTSFEALVSRLLRTKPQDCQKSVTTSTLIALKRLARRHQFLTAEIDETTQDLQALVRRANPALLAAKGLGPVTAAQLLVTGGDNPSRLTSEATFAALCGASPIPASSGKTNRYRLNRGGDREANCALHQIALVRLSHDPRTKDYAARRRAEGKSTWDILRCLKRAIAREVWHLLVHPEPVPRIDDLRPLRNSLGIGLQEAANAFNTWPARISTLERGTSRNDQLAEDYRAWLNDRANT